MKRGSFGNGASRAPQDRDAGRVWTVPDRRFGDAPSLASVRGPCFGSAQYPRCMALRVFLIIWALVIISRLLWTTVGRWNQRRQG